MWDNRAMRLAPAGSLALLVVLLLGPMANAIELALGDVVFSHFSQTVFHLHRSTGQSVVLAADLELNSASNVVVTHDLRVIVGTSSSLQGWGLREVDPVTGEVSVLLPLDDSPNHLAISESGELLVSTGGRLLFVDVDTLQADPLLVTRDGAPLPVGAATFGADGRIYARGGGDIVEIDPSTGVASSPIVTFAIGDGFAALLVDQDGQLIVAEAFEPAILRFDPTTGEGETVSSGGFLQGPAALALGPAGEILVADYIARGLVTIDPSSGSQQLEWMHSFDFGANLNGLAVVRPPPGCGNLFVDFGEQCDDGNQALGDGCRPDCTEEVCGDSVFDPQEECDDGNTLSGDTCDDDCVIPIPEPSPPYLTVLGVLVLLLGRSLPRRRGGEW